MVATNDLHYTRKEDAPAHEVLLCVQSGSTMADPNRFKLDGDDFYLKSPAEMRQVWRELPEACDNTLLIAERCEVSFAEGEGRYMPRFPVPDGESEQSWFVKEVEPGLLRRYPGGVSAEVRSRAEYETEVICSKGYAGYFLVVADFINWAKDNGIRVGPGRGSGAGAMTAYAMGITDLDPLAARADLRAVPQPRADVDARLRRRLRRAPPRRGDPLRHREVRRRPGRADRHLRHHQGQAGDQGLRPGCSATRSRWATRSPRRCRRRSWARTSRWPASSTRPTSGTPRRASSGAATRPTRTRSGSSTPPAAWRT